MMKAASSLMPKKFRSVREKNGHRRNRSSESGGDKVCGRPPLQRDGQCFLTSTQVRPLTADSWLSIFSRDSAKQVQKEKDGVDKEATKVGLKDSKWNLCTMLIQ